VTPQAKRKPRLLVVDDDPGLLRLLTIRLRAENYEVEAVENGLAALSALARVRPDLVITDLRMDQMDGIGLLKEIQNRAPGLRVIILTAHGTIPDAVQATQSGAFAFLTKPVDKQELLDQVQKALKVSGFADNTEDWRSEIITRSSVMEEKLSQAHMVAGTDARVMIQGELGTGKELLARAIHKASSRRSKPFVCINCSAMDEAQVEGELFGQISAATDSSRDQAGAFAAAEGGTLLIEDVDDLPMRLQVKLLRVLQENQLRRNGSNDATAINVRVISTSNADLKQMIAAGQFREDLFYRLNVVHIDLPPLNRRREDVPLLVAHFLDKIAKESGKSRHSYAPEAVELLVGADWPGNIRQLESVVRQNVALATSSIISVELVQAALSVGPSRLPSFDEARDEFTRNYLSQILQITQGNVSQAARLAKRNRTDFYKLLARHALSPDEFKQR
jgi:two-component system response regulator GlrR